MADTNEEQKTEPVAPDLSDAEKEAAEKEGAKEAYKKSGETKVFTASNIEGESVGDKYPDRSEIMPWAPLLDLGIEEFKKAISEKADRLVPESKVAGLLGLERSGKNRTPYVEAMVKRLKVDSVYDVVPHGPDYTNDITPVKKL